MKEKKSLSIGTIRPQNPKVNLDFEKSYKILLENRQKRSILFKKQ